MRSPSTTPIGRVVELPSSQASPRAPPLTTMCWEKCVCILWASETDSSARLRVTMSTHTNSVWRLAPTLRRQVEAHPN